MSAAQGLPQWICFDKLAILYDIQYVPGCLHQQQWKSVTIIGACGTAVQVEELPYIAPM